MKIRIATLIVASVVSSLALPGVTKGQTMMDQTMDSATGVLDEIMSVPAVQIPESLLASARGVAIIPNVVKGGFIVGVRHGRGVVMVRDDAGQWHPPIFVSLTGGSVGWQAGIQSTDVILVFRTRKSIEGLMSGKLTVGVDAAAAAGPIGRQASAATDARFAAEILSYSRSRGLFAGVSIDGSMIQLDYSAGSAYYQTPIVGANGEAIRPLNTVPPSALRLMNRLSQYSGSPQLESVAPTQTPLPAASTVSQAELVRQQLVTSWGRLSGVLDDRWRSYLSLPPEVLEGQPIDMASLQSKLQHYTAVASDQQYATLSRSPEFATTYHLLRDYVALQSSQSATRLTLPPPPVGRY